MRYLGLVLIVLLLGCVSAEVEQNETETNTSEPVVEPPPVIEKPKLAHFTTTEFTLQYPPDMQVSESPGKFIATKTVNSRPAEILAVFYYDTVDDYGSNKNKVLSENPSKGASDLLEEDIPDDSMGYLNNAELGEYNTFAIQRDGYGAEVPFKTTINNTKYTGYAMSIFVPERALHLNIRILTIDPTRAKQIRDDLVLTFRLE